MHDLIRIPAALLLGTLALAGCAVNPVTGKKELALVQVSTAEEIALGEKTFPQAIQQMGGEYTDPRLNAYINEIGQRLARVSERPDLPYRFVVVNESTPNAFALPGGFIAVTRGLLAGLENEAQLAAVLGHEIGHVTARHAVSGMQRGTMLNLGLAVLSGVTGDSAYGPVARQAGELTASLLDRSYSREQERESDRLGIDYMVRGGYDPGGAVQLQEYFFKQLEGGTEPGWVAGLLRTHPVSRERMEANEDYVRTRYPQALSDPHRDMGRESFLAATEKVRQSAPAYNLYEEARRLERKGNHKQAIANYLQAAAAAPEEPLILTGLGMAYLRAGDTASARRHLAKAVKLGGNYYLSRLGLGYSLLQTGEAEKALKELETSMTLLPTLQGAYLSAEAYEKTGQTARALDLYESVAQADPEGKLGRSAAERAQALRGA